jgi:hypothetical protein
MFYGFYDPSKDIITVHFFNEEQSKPDVIAFLNRNMTWDVREIVGEKSELFDDKEVVTITHKKIVECEHGGDFDKFVRKGINEMTREAKEKGLDYTDSDKMLKILEYNNYNMCERFYETTNVVE